MFSKNMTVTLHFNPRDNFRHLPYSVTMKRHSKDQMPPREDMTRPEPKSLIEPINQGTLFQKLGSFGRSLFREQPQGKEESDPAVAEMASLLKKNFQLAARRKRRMKLAGGTGLFLLICSGIGLWYWHTDRSFQVAMLRAQSSLWSIHIEPDMISIPAGSYQLAQPSQEDGSPGSAPPTIAIRKFLLGRFEVTFEEYDRFAIATGRPLPKDEGWGRGSRPVINVSWEDAAGYAQWLAEQTGLPYRLPSEAEWEYAARSGGKQDTWAGTSGSQGLTDYAWFDENSTGKTQPVGAKQPNDLGVYDMGGNVWEWVEDCWHDDQAEAPADGSAWLESHGGNCGIRVRRGGGWTDSSESLRTSLRNWYSADTRSTLIGFRLAADTR